jgi:phosphotransferase system enzyme I (PtsP)
VCGENGPDPAAAAVLLGLGFTSLSVSLSAYPRMKEAIRSLSVGKLRELAGEIMKMDNPKDVEDRVRSTIA